MHTCPFSTPGDGLARKRDHALDQVVDPGTLPVAVRFGFEDHDVAAVDVVEVVAQLVDEHAVADFERGDHRA